MEIEQLEALAFADDRAAAIATLIPGTDDHDYFTCIAAQHAGRLDDAQRVIDAWPGRHGWGGRLDRLARRQVLLRLGGSDVDRWADQVRDQAGADHSHQAEAAAAAIRYPNRLDPAACDRAALLARAVDYSNDLSQVRADGLLDLLDRDPASFDAARRRALVARLGRCTHPKLVAFLVAELRDKGARGFGSQPVHAQLTLTQLDELCAAMPELRRDGRWIDAVITRLRPAAPDWRASAEAAAAYFDRLWAFVSGLDPAWTALKAHVLYHRLDHDRHQGHYDRARFMTYLALPRARGYTRQDWLKRFDSATIAQPGASFGATDLAPVSDDEPLVRDYLYQFLPVEDGKAFGEWLEPSWLDVELAVIRLVSGDPDVERWTAILGPTRLGHLRDRVDLDLAVSNPARIASDATVRIAVDVKHVPVLTVKIFRINVPAWFAARGTDVDATIDLDGLTARDELTFTYAEPPLRRVRRELELPQCARPGVYVVELIGNGKSSRAVIRKGDLRTVVRVGVAGPVVSVADERGRPVLDATLWLGGREYAARPDGGIVVPFSTRPGRVTALVCHGDLAVRATFDHPAESYGFGARIHLEREALVAGQTARAVIRPVLTVAGRPAPLALVSEPRLEIAIVDVTGATSTREQPLTLVDDADLAVEWPVPEHATAVTVTVRGKVRIASEQRDLELADSAQVAIAEMRSTDETEMLYLAPTAAGHVVSLLGRSGEPRARRALAIEADHGATAMTVTATLETDERGRVELGALPGMVELRVKLPSGRAGVWSLRPQVPTVPGAVHGVAPRAPDEIVAVVPVPLHARAITLVELRGGAPYRDLSAAATRELSAVALRGLGAGSYELTASGLDGAVTIVIAPREASAVGGWLDDGITALELGPAPARLARLGTEDTAIAIDLADATPATRVHLIATRFASAVATGGVAVAAPGLARTMRQPPDSHYLSGRDLGDEYRYVIERRTAPRRPGSGLERPSLLLNPWALRTTSTSAATAMAGGAFAPPAPAPAMSRAMAKPQGQAASANLDAFAGHDFLPHAAIVLANLRPDPQGKIRIPRAELGGATSVRAICVGPGFTTIADLGLDEQPLAPRDLRLRLALPADGHFTLDQQVTPVATGEVFTVADLATAKLQVLDTVAKAHAYLLALGGDDTLREFGFVARWPSLDDDAKRAQYSKYACHELHLFLRFKDPAFFAAVVRPYLAHKRVKTFVDRWLLDLELASYLEPWAFGRLNAIERALLAQRMPAEQDAIARLTADEVELIPPDPEGDAHRIDTLIAGGALDADDNLGIADATRAATASAMEKADLARDQPEMLDDEAPPRRMREESAKKKSAPRPPAKTMMAAGFGGPPGAAGGMPMAESADFFAADMQSRAEIAPLFRAADKTQEWAENDWWHRKVDEMNASLVTVDRFWRDLAAHRDGGFLSRHLGDCAGNGAEALVALAVIDLPFVAGAHQVVAADGGLRLTAASPALIAWRQIVPVAAPEPAQATVLVGQSYFRADDRWTYEDGEQRDKPVTGELLVGVVYGCRVVISNPTGARERLAVLVQIPRGAIAVGGALPTRTLHVALDAYGTWSSEVLFYFPSAGTWSHFPVHVTRGAKLVACAAPGALTVVEAPTTFDATSWAHVSQHGTLDEVLAVLGRANLGRLELDKIAWRMRERAAFTRATEVLARRHVYSDVLWAYALFHRDRVRMAEWLRHAEDFVSTAGGLEAPPAAVGLDAVARSWLQHLEYAPLVNARAHRLGSRTAILNGSLDAQYRAFAEAVAHKPRATDDDRLAAAHYLFTMDRVDAALAMFDRVARGSVATPMPYDYVAAYAAVCRGDVAGARAAATPWIEHPVDRWRQRFAALIALCDQATAPALAPVAADPDSRAQVMTARAAQEPTLGLTIDGAALVVEHGALARCLVRFYPMDLELLFSRQPFVGADVGRFGFIEPAATLELALTGDGQTRVAIPDALRATNLVAEVVAGPLRKSAPRFAHDLAVQVVEAYGQVRVVRASTRAPVPAAYVKVYGRQGGGAVAFFKDGYTDLAGRFDYATLSTDDLDRVERFAILVVADDAGATVTEAGPPPR
ncbi:MAG: hypothetical protein K8W52_42105 [Deltaproteobacteria bacterium]|nr:hypothetical protein [Deltaproteobacteria bacterium]